MHLACSLLPHMLMHADRRLVATRCALSAGRPRAITESRCHGLDVTLINKIHTNCKKEVNVGRRCKMSTLLATASKSSLPRIYTHRRIKRRNRKHAEYEEDVS